MLLLLNRLIYECFKQTTKIDKNTLLCIEAYLRRLVQDYCCMNAPVYECPMYECPRAIETAEIDIPVCIKQSALVSLLLIGCPKHFHLPVELMLNMYFLSIIRCLLRVKTTRLKSALNALICITVNDLNAGTFSDKNKIKYHSPSVWLQIHKYISYVCYYHIHFTP